ncbi:unnamed protein product, partial [marine sediment metagenome]
PVSLGLSVNPQIFELDVFPGEKHPKRINVGNLSEVAIPITVRVTDFTAAEDSGEMLFDESSQDPSFASRKWFEIENPNFILEPKETKKVHFTIEVPENAEPGGHYAVMLFEPRLPSFYSNLPVDLCGQINSSFIITQNCLVRPVENSNLLFYYILSPKISKRVSS